MQYTTDEVAKLLHLSPRTVRQHIEKGNLASTKTGRDHFISKEEYERFSKMKRERGRPSKKS